MRKVLAAGGGMFPFEQATQPRYIRRDQQKIVLLCIVTAQCFRQLRLGRKMQKAIGAIMRRALIRVRRLRPFGAGYDLENRLSHRNLSASASRLRSWHG